MDQFGSGIFAVLQRIKEQRLAQGLPVVDLSIGAPNIPPAPHIIKALTQAACDPAQYVYAISDTAALQDAVSEWYKRRYGVTLDARTQVVSLLGSQDGLAHIALTLTNPSDIILVPDPCYPIFSDGPLLCGAKPYYMPQRKENGYIIDLAEIPEDIARAAKAILVSYPNNPTTAVAPDSFYRDLIAFAQKYELIVIHDNAYSELVFDGASCGSFLAFPGAMDVGVEFNSLSKTYGLAGARIGFCMGNKDIVEKMKTLKSNMDYGMFLPLQSAAIAALTGGQDCVAATRDAYEKRRDLLVDGLGGIGWKIAKPAGTMFVWAALPRGYNDSSDFSDLLAREAGVLVTPGRAFGPSGEGFVRMALVQDEPAIRQLIESVDKSGILRRK